MKTRILLTCLLVSVSLSGCYTVKVNYAPYDILGMPLLGESPLIQSSISEKKIKHRLGFMKKKGERFKYIRKIEKLNRIALNRFKKQTLDLNTYSDICELSTLSIQLVAWIAIFEDSQGAKVRQPVTLQDLSAFKTQKFGNQKAEAILSSSNLESEDGIVTMLRQIVEEIEKLLR